MSGRVGEGYDEPHAMAAWLEARGVPPADIVVDEGGHRTAATMADAAALGVRSAHVVTQGYHLPRALYFARHAGIDALGVPAPTRRAGWLDSLRVFVREIAGARRGPARGDRPRRALSCRAVWARVANAARLG